MIWFLTPFGLFHVLCTVDVAFKTKLLCPRRAQDRTIIVGYRKGRQAPKCHGQCNIVTSLRELVVRDPDWMEEGLLRHCAISVISSQFM
jgi:hypothetical protein